MRRISSVHDCFRVLHRPLLVAGCTLLAAGAALAILAQPAATELAANSAADAAEVVHDGGQVAARAVAPGHGVSGVSQSSSVGDHYEHVDTWHMPEFLTDVLPVDVALGPDDQVYIADGKSLALRVYDRDRHRLAEVKLGIPRMPSESAWPLAVDVDAARERLYVLWSHPASRVSFISLHGMDGSLVESDRIYADVSDGDLAVHVPSGDLFVYLDGSIARIDPGTWQREIVFLPAVRPLMAYANIAVFDNGRLAVCDPNTGQVDLLQADGAVIQQLQLPDESVPLAIDVDATNVLNVLVAAAEDLSASPGDPFVVRYDREGQPLGTRSQADVGAPQPGPTLGRHWPLGLDIAGDSALFSTRSAEMLVDVYLLPPDGPAVLVLAGDRPTGRYRPSRDRQEEPSPTWNEIAVANTPDGALLVLDGAAERLVRFELDGQAAVVGHAPRMATDLAVGPDGAAYVSTGGNRLVRMETTGLVTPTWELASYHTHGGRLAVAGTALYVSHPLQQRVAAIDLGSRAVLAHVELPDAVGLWPSDIVAGTSGRLFTGDVILSQVQSWRSPAAPDIIWQAGLLAGPRRLASVRLDDGSDVIGTYMADGFMELHSAHDGNLLSRWKPRLSDGSTASVSDLAVAPDGRVLVADKEARALQVFAPAVGPTPTPEAEAPPTPTPSDRSCRVEGDKVAGPPRIVLGETAQVTLTLAAECPDKVRLIGADILLVMDMSGSMTGPKLEAAKAAAENFVTLLDVRYHRAGVVAFNNDAGLLSRLTTDVGTVLAAIGTLSANGGTNITDGLRVAHQHLLEDGRAEALPVIVLLSDGAHTSGPPPGSAAQSARNSGIQIYAIGLGSGADEATLKEITGRPDRYFYAPTPDQLFPIYEEILREVLSSLAGNLIIDDEMADDIEYVAGSADPPALAQADRLRWGRSLLPSSGVTMTYAITPLRAGLLPTNRQAVADYNDGDGVRRQYVFPVPVIEVITPTPTPTNTPTVTPTPTNTPTATPVPKPAFLPILYKDHCLPGTAHADIVLLIDTSSSMDGVKIAQAKAAAATFVGLLNLRYDQAAVVGFDSASRLASPLTNDRERMLRAIDTLTTRPGTMIDQALWAAADVLQRSPQRRPDNVPVVILLSDGAHNGTAGEVLVAADAVRGSGALIFVIGLGSDADVGLLETVADPGRYFFAPDGGALEDIYRSIAVKIPCR